jgi:hypothetical protein
VEVVVDWLAVCKASLTMPGMATSIPNKGLESRKKILIRFIKYQENEAKDNIQYIVREYLKHM